NDGKYGFINRSGTFVIQPTFEWAASFSEGRAVIFDDHKYGYIDKSGRMVIKPRFTNALGFSEGLACVKIGGRTRKFFLGTQIVTTSQRDIHYAFVDKSG